MATRTKAPQPISWMSTRTSSISHMKDTDPPETVASFAKSFST